MKTERETLLLINELHAPRHLFVLPTWADPRILDRLIERGYLSFSHLQRKHGVTALAMGLEVTEKGASWLRSAFNWRRIAVRSSLAGISLTGLSVAILYLA